METDFQFFCFLSVFLAHLFVFFFSHVFSAYIAVFVVFSARFISRSVRIFARFFFFI